jgi:hypothetical protein
MNFLYERKLSQSASDLIEFDVDSIRQIVSSQKRGSPDVWLADPDQYEKNGRVLRDSDSPRMLAYSTRDRVLYATDGCNACARRPPANLESIPTGELKQFAEQNGLRLELLQMVVALLTASVINHNDSGH